MQVPYAIKCTHSLLLNKPEKLAPSSDLQMQIKEWQSKFHTILAPSLTRYLKVGLHVIWSGLSIVLGQHESGSA